MNPIVSLGIPTYGSYERLRICLESVLAQDYPCLDILVSDNNADLVTPECIHELVNQNHNITYIKQKVNIGLVSNENFVRSNRSGEYVVVIHDDDIIPSDYISMLMKVLIANDAIALAGPRCERFLDGKVWYTYQNLISTTKNQRQRLSQIARNAFDNPWGSEHLVYGIYRKDALPTSFRFGRWRSIILFLFLISIKGSVYTHPECVIQKHNQKGDLQKYATASYVKRIRLIGRLLGRRQEERITILYRLVGYTLINENIPLGTKLSVILESLRAYLLNKPEVTLAG